MAAFGGNADISHQKLTETLAGLGIRHDSDASTEGDGRRAWYDAAGVQLGRYDVAEGWRIIEGMYGGCYCDLPPADW